MQKLYFRSDGTFTILQVSDAQDMHFVRKTMLWMLDRGYELVKPDLVLFTGDNILGNHLCDRRFGSGQLPLTAQQEAKRMERALGHILRQPEERNIPFAMIFGNHDDRNQLSKRQQLALWRRYACFTEGDTLDNGSGELAVCDRQTGARAYTLWLVDTARYRRADDCCEECIEPQTVQWLRERSAQIQAGAREKTIPSMVFLHIPLPAVLSLLQCTQTGVPAPDGTLVSLNPQYARGVLRSYPSVVTDDGGLFDTLRTMGGVQAIVSGHDHNNCFVGSVDGIDLIQTSCASFRCYGEKNLRGVRVIRLHRTGGYDTKFLSYVDLCGDTAISRLRYFWDADEYEKKKAASLLTGGCAAVLAAGTGMAMAAIKRKNR